MHFIFAKNDASVYPCVLSNLFTKAFVRLSIFLNLIFCQKGLCVYLHTDVSYLIFNPKLLCVYLCFLILSFAKKDCVVINVSGGNAGKWQHIGCDKVFLIFFLIKKRFSSKTSFSITVFAKSWKLFHENL